MSAPSIAMDPALLMLLIIRIAVLTDQVETAHAANERQQREQQEWRLRHARRDKP